MTTKQTFSHEWSLICQRSLVDRESNLLSIIDAIEQVTITVPGPVGESSDEPRISMPIHVVSRFRKLTDTGKELGLEVLYEVRNPAGKMVGDAVPVSIVMKNGIRNYRTRVTLGRVPMNSSGLYMVHVKAREVGEVAYKRVGSAPLEVVINR